MWSGSRQEALVMLSSDSNQAVVMNSSGSRQADPLRMPIVKLEFKIVFSSRAVCPYHSDG